jgi:hypothetical protein
MSIQPLEVNPLPDSVVIPKPNPMPMLVALKDAIPIFNDQTKSQTEIKVKSIMTADKTFEELCKEKGYIRTDLPESKAIMMWKSSLIGLAVMLIGFFAKFLLGCYDPITDGMVWSVGAFIDCIYNCLMAITGVGFFSKMKKYYDVSAENM